jgi:hypothetical protein
LIRSGKFVQIGKWSGGWEMSADRERFEKVLAIAINPGAQEGEATAALNRARELVRKDPSLAHPAPRPSATAPPDHISFELKVTNIPQSWLAVMLSNLSELAYDFKLMIKMSCDFTQTLTTGTIKCDGQKRPCAEFEAHIGRLIALINKPANA